MTSVAAIEWRQRPRQCVHGIYSVKTVIFLDHINIQLCVLVCNLLLRAVLKFMVCMFKTDVSASGDLMRPTENRHFASGSSGNFHSIPHLPRILFWITHRVSKVFVYISIRCVFCTGNASDLSSTTVGIAVGLAVCGVVLVVVCLAVALLLIRRRRSRRRYDDTVTFVIDNPFSALVGPPFVK